MNYLNPQSVNKLSTLFVFISLLVGITFLKKTSLQRNGPTHLGNKRLNLKPYLVFKQVDTKNSVELKAILPMATLIK